MVNVIVQNLGAYADEISADSLSLRADLLAITETSMDGAALINMVLTLFRRMYIQSGYDLSTLTNSLQ